MQQPQQWSIPFGVVALAVANSVHRALRKSASCPARHMWVHLPSRRDAYMVCRSR
jgi:hypothetical protein